MKNYINPLGKTPIYMGDPFVYRHNGKYYLTGTTSSKEGFQYWTSEDLVNWTYMGWIYRKRPDCWAKEAFWAPEVKFYREKFYLTYSARDKKTGRFLIALAASERPEGPFEDLYAPWFDFGYAAIDGHIFVDDDEKPYLYFSRNGFDADAGVFYGINYGVLLARDLTKPAGEPVKLTEADMAWEKALDNNRCNEGVTILKYHRRYYMTYSANNTGKPCYSIGYAVSEKPLGPWIKPEENLIAASNPEIGVSGPGHNSIIESPDGKEMFMFYHTHADPREPSEERVVNMDRIFFDEKGRLRVAGPTRSPQPMPSGCEKIQQAFLNEGGSLK